jgi:hypothetical protein
LERLIDQHHAGAAALPTGVLVEMQRMSAASPPPGLVCGNCKDFEPDTRKCRANRWTTTATELACVVYVRREA